MSALYLRMTKILEQSMDGRTCRPPCAAPPHDGTWPAPIRDVGSRYQVQGGTSPWSCLWPSTGPQKIQQMESRLVEVFTKDGRFCWRRRSEAAFSGVTNPSCSWQSGDSKAECGLEVLLGRLGRVSCRGSRVVSTTVWTGGFTSLGRSLTQRRRVHLAVSMTVCPIKRDPF